MRSSLLNHDGDDRTAAAARPPWVRNGVIARLPPPSRERLLAAASVVALPIGTCVFRQGDRIESLHFPLSGLASVMSCLSDGDEVEVALVGREGCIGLPLLLGRRTMNVDVVVQAAGEALRVPAAAVLRLAADCVTTRDVLLQYVDAVLINVQSAAACNRVHPLVQRLARRLLMCHDRLDGDAFAMTHESLARMLGVRRASVTVAAEGLQRTNAIAYRRGRVTIVDRAALERLSCECYATSRQTLRRLLAGD